MKSSERTLSYSSILIVVLFGVNIAKADDYFDPDFLTSPSGEALNVDLSAFEKSSFIPGTYRVDVYLNEKYVNTQEVLLNLDKNTNKLQPCFSDVQLADYGIKPEYYSLLDKSGDCVNLSGIPGADAEFKGNIGRLYLRKRWIPGRSYYGMTAFLQFSLITVFPVCIWRIVKTTVQMILFI